MDGITGQLALVVVLIVLNAAFAGSEIALISLREGQLARLAEQSSAGRVLARLVHEPNRFLSTIQIGITLAGFLASATAAVSLAQPLIEPLGFLGGAARPTAVFLVTLALTFVTLVVGELAPKRLAMQRAERWSLLAARPLAGLARLAAPAIWLLSHATDLTVRLFGGDPSRRQQDVTTEEIRDLVASRDAFSSDQRRVIAGALQVADRTLRQVLVPRSQILALSTDLPVEDALEQLVANGRARAPVYHSELDDADLTVSVLGLVGRTGTVGDHARRCLALPESLDVIAALRALQHAHQQLALVVSEHGGVEGMVTIEDLVEELVGEIQDEHDREIAKVERHPEGGYVVPGDFPLHELPELGLEAHSDEVTTVGGLVIELLGRIPAVGDRVELESFTCEVLSTRRRAVSRVRLQPATPPSDAPDASSPTP